MSGYWKVWHDMRGRFIVAACLVVWQVYATSGPLSMRNQSLNEKMALPKICIGAALGSEFWEGWDKKQDYQTQLKYCKDGESPNPAYAYQAMEFAAKYNSNVWDRTMPVLMLFVGILLSVGAPFGGESAESSTLTFSLPWSRLRWLRTKIQMTAGLVAGLVSFVLISGHLVYQLPALDMLSRYDSGLAAGPLGALPSFIAGLVGITLGITATLITRNALAGAISASFAAYLLGLVDWARFQPDTTLNATFVVMDFTTPMGVFMAGVVIAVAISLTWYKLEERDF